MVTKVMQIITIVIMGIVTAGMIGTIGFKILGGIQESNLETTFAGCGLNATGGTGGAILYNACGYEYNVTANMQEFGENTTSQLPLLGTITGLVFLFGAIGLIGVFGARKTGLM